MTPYERTFDTETVLQRLKRAWSAESSSLWTEDTPARGHCGVTALVVHDHFGGDIQKTLVNSEPHFYNFIEGQRYDLTAEQFDEPPVYLDLQSNRKEAFSDTNEHQYTTLSKRFRETFSNE